MPATVVPPFFLLPITNARSLLDVFIGLLNVVSPSIFSSSELVPTLIFPLIIEMVAGTAPCKKGFKESSK